MAKKISSKPVKRGVRTTKTARQIPKPFDPEEFFLLRFGMSDRQIADLAGVSSNTAKRWRQGDPVPFAVMELLRLRRGTLPLSCGAFAGFQIVEDRLFPPDFHWQDGVSAKDVRNWWILRQIVARHLGRRFFAVERPAFLPSANDAENVIVPLRSEHEA